jgi:two-component system sensor histidine kinase BaeS
MPGSVPLRRSLLVRQLAASILIAVCSIIATAWLAAQTTTREMEREQGQIQVGSLHVLDMLTAFAATHSSWDGVGPLVQNLASETGWQVALATQSRIPIAASRAGGSLPEQPVTVVDPLHVDPALQPAAVDRIDTRAAGPYQLSADQQQLLVDLAVDLNACLRTLGATRQVKVVNAVTWDYSTSQPDPADSTAAGGVDRPPAADQVQQCRGDARRRQLTGHVAPPALLFIVRPGTGATVTTSRLSVSAASTAKIAVAAALILVTTIVITVLTTTRLIRPLRTLTAAAADPSRQALRVPVRGNDEIAALAAALNRLTDRRERADQQRKAMVNDIAHELRTPLANIRSWLEAFEDQIATPQTDPALAEALVGEAVQLQHLVNDLQDLASADSGMLRLHPRPTWLSDLLHRAYTAHRGRTDAAGIALEVEMTAGTTQPAASAAAADGTAGPVVLPSATGESDPDITLLVDEVRMTQAIGNLMANAIRYTPRGGRIRLCGRVGADQVAISVIDTGPGIAAADLPHVFDRFWRADQSRSRDTGGSGLGLAIVRKIVEMHGGTAWATSTVGRGATFGIQLPVAGPERD